MNLCVLHSLKSQSVLLTVTQGVTFLFWIKLKNVALPFLSEISLNNCCCGIYFSLTILFVRLWSADLNFSRVCDCLYVSLFVVNYFTSIDSLFLNSPLTLNQGI